ncbi:putative polysaccharide biosynthesis protein [Lachnobacterium bovis]|uniref:Stage V sporulation protein B n=1 Tax=Lachnobacterium bovis TaxID=140626 RepID=A0A1H9PZR9_9FIRM|nr:polysaccharide biosynthesis protein [Lachnobacterium bovis]SER53650.1 stage V sporulation protein B [Lachnobacterium bovis]
MSQSKKNRSNFLVQGSILAMASIISRIIGLLYRLPMTDILGDVGIGYYGTAFEIYNVMLIISSYSLPLAVSKLVSAKLGQGNKAQAYQILKGAIVFAIASGGTVSLIVFFGADYLARLMNTPMSAYALRVLGPGLIIVAVLGVIRGFFQGTGTMVPSAISQIIEQIVNAIVSVWAAYVLFNYGTRIGKVLGDQKHYSAAYGAAGGTLGTVMGSLAALVFVCMIFLTYLKVFKKKMRKEKNVEIDSFSFTMKMLIATIIPVLLSTTVYNISASIDQGIFKNIAALQGYSQDLADGWYGVFTGKYRLLINVPISIASAMVASAVPKLTSSYAQGDLEAVRYQIQASTRFIMVIAFPCTVGLMALGRPILILLFPTTLGNIDVATNMMLLGSVAIIFYSISTLSNGLLQGIDKLKIPVINALIALVTHVLLLIFLMLAFRLGIYAVVIANTFFAFIMCFLNSRAIVKYSGFKREYKKTYIIPAICSMIMGVLTFFAYHGMYKLCRRNFVAIIFAFIIAFVSYGTTLLLLKGLTEDELRHFPGGRHLVKMAKIIHLM